MLKHRIWWRNRHYINENTHLIWSPLTSFMFQVTTAHQGLILPATSCAQREPTAPRGARTRHYVPPAHSPAAQDSRSRLTALTVLQASTVPVMVRKPLSRLHINLRMLGNFFKIFFFEYFQTIHCFHPFFCWYIFWMSNNLDLRWSPTFCGDSSGSKLFAKVINGLQNSPLAG